MTRIHSSFDVYDKPYTPVKVKGYNPHVVNERRCRLHGSHIRQKPTIQATQPNSNQLPVNEQMSIPENREMFMQAVKEYKGQGWSAVLDRINVLLCAQNIDNIQGRVLLQSNASWPEPGAEMPASTSIGPLFGGKSSRRFWHLKQYHKVRINS
ncbi:hypothetical protein NA56DRAFT_751525 [Hyaloscypha hepaticicola]|uniref:Uncharacterized protein n=1 Tax=Hyaloscypha hepaticicola TaxID=2082293 RepID=A0A2J6PW68_9HELO|nr:hypothetical protein NA56DRAFT_751525 [Hyaloscypha hepaticicola]